MSVLPTVNSAEVAPSAKAACSWVWTENFVPVIEPQWRSSTDTATVVGKTTAVVATVPLELILPEAVISVVVIVPVFKISPEHDILAALPVILKELPLIIPPTVNIPPTVKSSVITASSITNKSSAVIVALELMSPDAVTFPVNHPWLDNSPSVAKICT